MALSIGSGSVSGTDSRLATRSAALATGSVRIRIGPYPLSVQVIVNLEDLNLLLALHPRLELGMHLRESNILPSLLVVPSKRAPDP